MRRVLIGLTVLALTISNPFLLPIRASSERVAVVLDTFTVAAYTKGAFYDYYCDVNPHAKATDKFCNIHNESCNPTSSCLTVQLKKGEDGQQITQTPRTLAMLQQLMPDLETLTDVQVSKHPEVLAQYNRIIILHNEYVTRTEFTAITQHKNVVYLFPNALYAQVVYDETNNEITLVRGHGYPNPSISNGFDWPFDNTIDEDNRVCNNWGFEKLHDGNGIQLNCWPEITRYDRFVEILKTL